MGRRWFIAGGVAAGAACLAGWRSDGARHALADLSRTPPASNPDSGLGSLCSSRNARGVGLRGEYFPQEGLAGAPLLIRTDAEVDFDAGFDWPAHPAPAPRSARWSGWIKAALSGPHRFHVDHAHARLVVGHTDFSVGTASPADRRPVIDLAAGRFYPVDIQLDRATLAAGQRLRLEWTPPHGLRFLVARASLFLPTPG